jgi:hypothetical protein
MRNPQRADFTGNRSETWNVRIVAWIRKTGLVPQSA